MSDRCQDILDRLIEATTGSIPPHERAGIAEHLAACQRCRDEAAAIEGTVAYLRAARQFTVPPGFWTEFTDRLHERIADGRRPLSDRLRRWMASPRHAWGTAALTAVLVVAVAILVRFGPAPPAPQDPANTSARALMTDTMTKTLPSLADMLETMRAGLAQDSDSSPDRTRP
jgi:anti-sigma factor RsiW